MFKEIGRKAVSEQFLHQSRKGEYIKYQEPYAPLLLDFCLPDLYYYGRVQINVFKNMKKQHWNIPYIDQ